VLSSSLGSIFDIFVGLIEQLSRLANLYTLIKFKPFPDQRKLPTLLANAHGQRTWPTHQFD